MQFCLDHVRKIYEKFPRPSVPQNLDLADDDDDDDMQKLSEAIAAAKTRVECCSSFLKASIKLDTLSLSFLHIFSMFVCKFLKNISF